MTFHHGMNGAHVDIMGILVVYPGSCDLHSISKANRTDSYTQYIYTWICSIYYGQSSFSVGIFHCNERFNEEEKGSADDVSSIADGEAASLIRKETF